MPNIPLQCNTPLLLEQSVTKIGDDTNRLIYSKLSQKVSSIKEHTNWHLYSKLLNFCLTFCLNDYHWLRCNTGIELPGYPPGTVPVPENPLGTGDGCRIPQVPVPPVAFIIYLSFLPPSLTLPTISTIYLLNRSSTLELIDRPLMCKNSTNSTNSTIFEL